MRFAPVAARLGLVALFLAVLIAAGAILSVRLGGAGFATGLEVMTAPVALAAIAFVLSLVWLVSALKHNRGEAKRVGLIGFFGSILLLYVPLHTVYRGYMAPPVQDVTTDPEDPPAFVALAGRATGADGAPFNAKAMIHYRGEYNTVSYMLHEYYSELTKPLALLMPPAKMFWRCFEAAKRMGWQIVAYNEKEGRIEATATSFWFGRVSDIVIRVRPAGSLGARFDMRARSETGTRDFGRNLELMKDYRAALNT